MLKINKYEYGFLEGDMVMYPSWGAALAVVMSFCRKHDLGGFGKPTEKGCRLMEEYRLNRTPVSYDDV